MLAAAAANRCAGNGDTTMKFPLRLAPRSMAHCSMRARQACIPWARLADSRALAYKGAQAPPRVFPRHRFLQTPMDALAEAKIKRLTHRETLLIVIGMLLPVFMGSLDQTILASALPTIGRELCDAHDLPWLITAYLLASTAMIPLYGKIADIHGRALALRIAIAVHFAGSLICALAPSMLLLILARALQGIGGGGLASMGMVVLATSRHRASAAATTPILR
jgi:hypothetical protein